jgi:hypothetical protein
VVQIFITPRGPLKQGQFGAVGIGLPDDSGRIGGAYLFLLENVGDLLMGNDN